MRVAGWRGKEVEQEFVSLFHNNAESFMESVAEAARSRCPIGTITREGKFSTAHVSFTPKTGKNKGSLVSFDTEHRWMGRNPYDLRNSIRVVIKEGKSNIRVYAGNFKVYWAFMVERGTASTGWGKGTKAQPFLRPAFFIAKAWMLKAIREGKK